YPGISPLRGDEAAAQARLFEAVSRLGGAVADQAPLVIFVDDAQWADAASLHLLHYAARRWADADAPILLLLSIRSEALSSTPALVEWVTNLGRDLTCVRLELEALTYDDTRQWIQGLGRGPG
ncbi:MAG: AAA family ATPase, partial [Anaerolineae bacterium]|nr:AAA family ATPase [Anaerolineae bacterium]